MGKLQDDTALTERDGRLFATLSRDWEIWGPNGGYVSAIALRAAGKIAPAGHRPVTISVQYLSAGKFAEAEAIVEPVKQGRTAWCINVALVQDGKRFLQAQVWTTDRSDGPTTREVAMPEVAMPAALRSWDEILPPDAPRSRFWANFESKPLVVIPFGERNPKGSITQDWYRFRDFDSGSDPFLDCARALLLIDTVPWPAFNRGLAERIDYIAPSLDVSVWFHTPPQGDWLFVDAHSGVADGGLIQGTVRVWTEDRRLVASGGSHMLVARRG
ncbi:MAG TPA: thioesterase family protein [Rhizomicrobium sp.]|nr:thioesterase family protein [Rhizomicrobium sp.]